MAEEGDGGPPRGAEEEEGGSPREAEQVEEGSSWKKGSRRGEVVDGRGDDAP